MHARYPEAWAWGRRRRERAEQREGIVDAFKYDKSGGCGAEKAKGQPQPCQSSFSLGGEPGESWKNGRSAR